MTKEHNRQKREVWNGERAKTSSGLRKGDLMKNKNGKIVSKKQHKKGLELHRMMKKEGRLAEPFKKKSRSRSKSPRSKRSKRSKRSRRSRRSRR